MPYRPLRFIHAASLRLDQPLSGVADLPDDLRATAQRATVQAWQNIVAAAVAHDVDAVLLCGDTLSGDDATLTAEIALRQGLESLAEKQIPVFIVAGSSDPPAVWEGSWPDNAHFIHAANEESIDLTADGQPYAVIVPVGVSSSFAPPELERIAGKKRKQDWEPFVIGVHSPFGSSSSKRSTAASSGQRSFASVHYLAAGPGAPESDMPLTDGRIHRQSPPQAISPKEAGARSVTLVDVDASGRVERRDLSTASVRFETIELNLENAESDDDLLERATTRFEELSRGAGESMWIVDWKLSGGAWNHRLASPERRETLRRQLTELADAPRGLRSVHRLLPPADSFDVDDDPGSLWSAYRKKADARLRDFSPDPHLLWGLLSSADATADDGPPTALRELTQNEIARRVRSFGHAWLAPVEESKT